MEPGKFNYEEEGKSNALSRIFTKFWTDYYWENTIELEEFCTPDVFPLVVKWMQTKKVYGQFHYYLITINPIEGIMKCGDLFKLWKKWKRKKWIEKSIACIEWRDVNNGMHLHAKIMLNKKMKRSHIRQSLIRTFKKYVGNNMHIHLVGSNRKGCFADYIRGKRKNRFKKNHSFDLMNRKFNKIPEVF